jgi:hypothetical protein
VHKGALIRTLKVEEKKKILTISKGYRLRPATHKLIKAVQKKLNLSQEKVINSAITYYYESVKNSRNVRNLYMQRKKRWDS